MIICQTAKKLSGIFVRKDDRGMSVKHVSCFRRLDTFKQRLHFTTLLISYRTYREVVSEDTQLSAADTTCLIGNFACFLPPGNLSLVFRVVRSHVTGPSQWECFKFGCEGTGIKE